MNRTDPARSALVARLVARADAELDAGDRAELVRLLVRIANAPGADGTSRSIARTLWELAADVLDGLDTAELRALLARDDAADVEALRVLLARDADADAALAALLARDADADVEALRAVLDAER